MKKQTFADGGTLQFAYTVVNAKSAQTEFSRSTGIHSPGHTKRRRLHAQ